MAETHFDDWIAAARAALRCRSRAGASACTGGAVAGDGHFVVENYIPALQQLALGEIRHLFTATPTHVGFEEYDIARQVAVSHHYWVIDGELRTFSSPHRYVWPSELDLMACLAGLELRERWSDWHREAFTSESLNHVSVWTTAPARHT